MSYLFIPHIKIQGANMLSSLYAITAAQPMAFVLFAHALGRKTGTQLNEVAVIYHDVQPLGSLSKYGYSPNQPKTGFLHNDPAARRAKEGFGGLSAQANATMDLEVSLLFKLGERKPRRVESALSSMRIAGGQIVGFEDSLFMESLDELPLLSGWWMIERSDLINVEDPLGSMMDACARPGINPNLAAATLGYALTSPPDNKKEGLRNDGSEVDYPHAFCEPMLGLVQFVSVRKGGDAKIPFWKPAWLSEEVFVVKT